MAQALGQSHHMAANGTALIRIGFGQFVSVTVNQKGVTGNLLTVYDGVDAGGTVVAIIDTATALGTFLYDVVLKDGLFVALAGGAAADLTIVWA